MLRVDMAAVQQEQQQKKSSRHHNNDSLKKPGNVPQPAVPDDACTRAEKTLERAIQSKVAAPDIIACARDLRTLYVGLLLWLRVQSHRLMYRLLDVLLDGRGIPEQLDRVWKGTMHRVIDVLRSGRHAVSTTWHRPQSPQAGRRLSWGRSWTSARSWCACSWTASHSTAALRRRCLTDSPVASPHAI